MVKMESCFSRDHLMTSSVQMEHVRLRTPEGVVHWAKIKYHSLRGT